MTRRIDACGALADDGIRHPGNECQQAMANAAQDLSMPRVPASASQAAIDRFPLGRLLIAGCASGPVYGLVILFALGAGASPPLWVACLVAATWIFAPALWVLAGNGTGGGLRSVSIAPLLCVAFGVTVMGVATCFVMLTLIILAWPLTGLPPLPGD